MTEADKDEVAARYGRGQTVAHIAFALGKCRKRVAAAIRERGLEVKGRGRKSGNPNWGFRGGIR